VVLVLTTKSYLHHCRQYTICGWRNDVNIIMTSRRRAHTGRQTESEWTHDLCRSLRLLGGDK